MFDFAVIASVKDHGDFCSVQARRVFVRPSAHAARTDAENWANREAADLASRQKAAGCTQVDIRAHLEPVEVDLAEPHRIRPLGEVLGATEQTPSIRG